MTFRLTPGPGAGAWRTAVLIETRRDIAGGRHGVWVRASVAPVAVFLIRDGEVRAVDAAGRGLALSVIEDLYPGLANELARLS